MSIFDKIIEGEIPAHKLYEDDLVLAFKDIQPKAPFHALVIPKKRLTSLADASPDDAELLGKVLLVAARIAQEAGLDGYRVVANTGESAGQSVFHLHFHVLGGRPLSWPPG